MKNISSNYENSKLWSLFIDDERYPSDKSSKKFTIARDYCSTLKLIEQNGCPIFISFDHDLGESSLTGFDLAKFLVELDLDLDGSFISDSFSFTAHSANNIGKENIEQLLKNYIEHKTKKTFKIK